MAKGNFPVEKLAKIETPFYYYDTELLRQTLRTINDEEVAEDIVFPFHLDEVEILAECYEKAVAHRIIELKARLDEI